MEVTINLKEATSKDFLEVSHIKPGGGKAWKLICGIPYWMKNSKGKIENKNYRTTDATDLEEFGDYLKRRQIFIPK